MTPEMRELLRTAEQQLIAGALVEAEQTLDQMLAIDPLELFAVPYKVYCLDRRRADNPEIAAEIRERSVAYATAYPHSPFLPPAAFIPGPEDAFDCSGKRVMLVAVIDALIEKGGKAALNKADDYAKMAMKLIARDEPPSVLEPCKAARARVRKAMKAPAKKAPAKKAPAKKKR